MLSMCAAYKAKIQNVVRLREYRAAAQWLKVAPSSSKLSAIVCQLIIMTGFYGTLCAKQSCLNRSARGMLVFCILYYTLIIERTINHPPIAPVTRASRIALPSQVIRKYAKEPTTISSLRAEALWVVA